MCVIDLTARIFLNQIIEDVVQNLEEVFEDDEKLLSEVASSFIGDIVSNIIDVVDPKDEDEPDFEENDIGKKRKQHLMYTRRNRRNMGNQATSLNKNYKLVMKLLAASKETTIKINVNFVI